MRVDSSWVAGCWRKRVIPIAVVATAALVLLSGLGRAPLADDLNDVDLSEDMSVASSASDLGRVEVIPTPQARPEVVAEWVPTPVGLPEHASRRGESPRMQRVRRPPISDAATEPEDRVVLNAGPKKNELEADGEVPMLSPTSPLERSDGNRSDDGTQPSRSGEAPPAAGMIDVSKLVGLEPDSFREWPVPEITLFVTGQQHGYIEPCGCTGLENQKGGVARRMTLMKQLRDAGWELMPIDAGNLVRRLGDQAAIKFHRSIEALRTMQYVGLGFGPDDIRLNVTDLVQEAFAESEEEALYASANVVLLDPSFMPRSRVIERGAFRIGVSSVLDPEALDSPLSPDIEIQEPIRSAMSAVEEMQSERADFVIVTFFGDEDRGRELARQVNGIDLLVVAGGYGEPTYRPERISDTKTDMILTGAKGMYAGLVGLYAEAPLRYCRVPLTDEYGDAPEMRSLMAEYQGQLQQLGLSGLGLKPIPHRTGEQFVGTEKCGECHTDALDVWKWSMHAEATEHIVHPGERGDVARHFDPECLSCHVTGWNPQGYYPYASGYLSLEASEHLHGNGCENCHGPGSSHVAAEVKGSGVDEKTKLALREAMRLPLDKARERCMECHDLDNSPDFHEEDAFDDYWAQIEHYGVD
ncbi:MAG: multiheme c-type cytochrome [Planctomycetota bacterium]